MAAWKKQSTLNTVCIRCGPRSSACSWQTRPTTLWGHSRAFDEPDGSFGFRLLPVIRGFSFSSVGPGESLEFGYDYFATASTGFGETAVFAAIGDPFDLTAGGGRFEFQVERHH
jgi:hypothetical protein